MQAIENVRAYRCRKLVTSASACGALIAGILTHAPARAEWEVVPDIGLNAHSEENPRLNPDTLVTDTSAATSAVLSATANIASIEQRGSFAFAPSVISYQYVDEKDSELESTDWFLNGSGEYRWQTVNAGFRADFSRERLLNSEVVSVDPDGNPDTDGPDAADSGRLAFISGQRERYWLNPYLGLTVSERNTLRLEIVEDRISFTEGDLAVRTGYDNTRFSAGIHRNVDDRNVVSATMSVESFKTDQDLNNTDTVTIEGAFARPVTELWTFNFAAGVLRSEFEFLGNNQQQVARATTDYTMRLGLRKRSERSRINMDLTREVYPSTSGFSAIRREFIVFYDRDLRQRLNASFGIRLDDSESLGDINVQDDREYARAEIDFTWAMKPVWFLAAGYAYTAQDFTEDLIQQKTSSNSVYIGISYRGLSKTKR
jgi:hypothetical protein